MMLHGFWSFSRPVIGRRLLVVTLCIHILGGGVSVWTAQGSRGLRFVANAY
jgi:hypothetical protein